MLSATLLDAGDLTVPLRRLASRAEGEAYFDSWVRDGGRILRTFAQRIEAAGGPVSALTFAPDSLPEVFAFATGRVRLVQDDVVDDGNLPAWLVAGPVSPRGGYDPESARWVDGLSRYYGEVLVRHLPGVRWVVADEPRHRQLYPDQWWPVVSGPLLAVNPLYAGGLAAKQNRLPSDQRDEGWLLDNYRSYLRIATENRVPDHDEAGAWGVGEVDHEPTMARGWRYEVSGAEDEDLDEAHADDLTNRLELLPGVTQVEREDRTAWLVAGEVPRDALEAVVRGWAREARTPSRRRGRRTRRS